jgi:excisionase family DNA binding protein
MATGPVDVFALARHPASANSNADAPDTEAPDDDVLLADEVARLVRMNVKTVYEQAKAGNLPCWRAGRQFRFSRRAVMAHLGQCKAAPYRRGK